MTTLPVFLASEPLPGVDGSGTLTGPEGRHAATVRRIRRGEQLMLTDGAGGLARCEVLGAADDRVELRVLARVDEPAPPLRVTLVQALIKGDRGELAVELATETGVDVITPWRAARCIARWEPGPRTEKALRRWRDTATSAAKQARRSHFPTVTDPASTEEIAQRCRIGVVTLVLHEGAQRGLIDVELPAEGEVVIVVGPEGGISPQEIEELTSVGAVAVRLGPQVVRASTAGSVALSVIGALSERWRMTQLGDTPAATATESYISDE